MYCYLCTVRLCLYSYVCTVLSVLYYMYVCMYVCLYCTVLYCTVLYCTVLYCTVLYWSACLPACPPACLYVCLAACLVVCLSVCHFVMSYLSCRRSLFRMSVSKLCPVRPSYVHVVDDGEDFYVDRQCGLILYLYLFFSRTQRPTYDRLSELHSGCSIHSIVNESLLSCR